MACFDECGCICRTHLPDFDQAIKTETRFDVDLVRILNAHAGWYSDLLGEFGDSKSGAMELRELGLARLSGVYILWHQDDYCETHEFEHLQAFYVGKAGSDLKSRLMEHWAKKEVGGELTTEVSVWPCPNRQAKYLEQLFLDIYDFPLNRWENPGTTRLCHHIAPSEWN